MQLIVTSSGGGGTGLTKVADATARTALSPIDGDVVVQLDTDEIWLWDGAAWQLIAAPASPISITDTDSIDLTITGTALSAVIRLSANAAAANNQLVDLNVESTGSVGLRAQIPDSRIRGVLSGTAPVSYVSATGVISMAVATDIADGYFSAADHVLLTTVISDLAAHLADAVDAHDASAISVVPTGNLASSEVQAALVELQGDIDTLNSVSHVAVTIAAFGATPNANGLSLSTQALNMQPADETNPGGVSTAAQVFGGEKRFPGGVGVNANTAIDASAALQVGGTDKGAIPMPVLTTAQRNLIGSPATGLMIYNSSARHPEFYNGTVWEPIAHTYINGTQTVTGATNITTTDVRKQLMPVAGNGGPVTAADISTVNALNGDILILIGTSSTNTVTVVSAAGTSLNGDCVLAYEDTLTLVHLSSKWYEIARSN